MRHTSIPTVSHCAKLRALLWAGRRKFVTLGAAVVVLAALLVLAFLVSANLIAGNYQTQLKTYRGSVTSELNSASQQISAASSDTAGLTKVQQALQSLQKNLKTKTQSQPKLATVPLGAFLSGNYKTAHKQSSNLQKAMTDLSNAVDGLTAFSNYNQQVSVALVPILSQKSLTAANYANEQAVWQAAATKLSTITPPTNLKAAHDKLKSALADNATLWAQVDAAYKATDIAKFNDLQSKLGQAVTTMLQQSTALRQYQTILQKTYSSAYAELTGS